jgi:hypothetical protein
VLRLTVIALEDGSRSEAGQADRLPRRTSNVAAELDGTSSVLA